MLLAGDQLMLLHSASSSSSSSLQHPMGQQQQQQQQRQLQAVFEPAAEAEIKLAFHSTGKQLTVHVIEARNLRSQSAQRCNSFVRLGFSPESGSNRGAKWQTGPVPNTDFPLFDRHFAIDLPSQAPPLPTSVAGGDSMLRRGHCLMVSVWSQIQNGGFSEFLGCATFPVQSLIGVHKPSSWYRLVNEMTASITIASSSTSTADSAAVPPLPTPAPAGGGFDLKEALIRRAPDRGLGFTVAGSGPSHVSKVERRSPADAAGVRAGDYILRVDGRRVAESDNETVVRLLRNTGGAAAVRLLLGRSRSCQHQLPMTSPASSASAIGSSSSSAVASAVAKSPSLPLSYCKRLLDKQNQQQHQQQQQQKLQNQQPTGQTTAAAATVIKRDIKSLYDISSTQNGQIASFAPAIAAGYQMRFCFMDQLIVRPSEMLMHSGPLTMADVKTGATTASIRVFLFPDLLLLAQTGSQLHPGRDQDGLVHELLRDPIHIHQITQCFVIKGHSDLSLKYIGADGGSQHLRLRCPAGERDCYAWCRRIQDRLLQTVIL